MQPAEGITKHQQASSAWWKFHQRESFPSPRWDGCAAASAKLCMLKLRQKRRVAQHFGALCFKSWEVNKGECYESAWVRKSFERHLNVSFFCPLTVRLCVGHLKEIKWQIHRYITESTWKDDAPQLKESCWLWAVGYLHLETSHLMNYQIHHRGAKVQPATFPSLTHWHSSKQRSGTLRVARFPISQHFFTSSTAIYFIKRTQL